MQPSEPSAPPPEDLSVRPRGVVRPHFISPFVRNVKVKKEVDEAGDMAEAVSCLLDFSKRRGLVTPPPTEAERRPHYEMVRNFATSTPKTTPVSTPRRPRDIPPTPFTLGPSIPRPPSPPRIQSRRILPLNTPRPRPLRRPAALGAPPVDDDEMMAELPDIPESPASPTASDLTMISNLSTYYSSEDEDDDAAYSEYEYADPYEDEGPYSTTPPPECDAGRPHMVCVPPAWGEMISGSPVVCRCILCHEDGRHHAIKCKQCGNAPGCCACSCGYMRSRYNSGCPLCRAGDPMGEDPLGADQVRRRLPPRRRGRRVVPGGMVVGIGRVRGQGRRTQRCPEQEEQEQQEHPQQPPQRARRGRRGRGRGRAVTIEDQEVAR